MHRARFPGFPRKGVSFLAALQRNNRRPWFEAREAEFQRHVREPMLAFVDVLNGVLAAVDPACVTEPAKALTRMHRDLRFTRDRSPYWSSLGAHLHGDGGPRASPCGYFVVVGGLGAVVAGGARRLAPGQLATIRRHIADAPSSFRALVEARGLDDRVPPLESEQLARVPRGFPADHPAADLLRWREIWLQFPLSAERVTTPRLVSDVARRLRALAPLVRHLRSLLA